MIATKFQPKAEQTVKWCVIIQANKNSARENPRAVIGRQSQGWQPYWLVTVYSIFKLLSLSLLRRAVALFISLAF